MSSTQLSTQWVLSAYFPELSLPSPPLRCLWAHWHSQVLSPLQALQLHFSLGQQVHSGRSLVDLEEGWTAVSDESPTKTRDSRGKASQEPFSRW